MLKAYLLVFEPAPAVLALRALRLEDLNRPPLRNLTMQDLLSILNSRSEIKNWLTITSGAVVIISSLDLKGIIGIIRTPFPNAQFILTEIDRTKIDGWMPTAVWNLINTPESSGRWPG